jgi:hypothetical protein
MLAPPQSIGSDVSDQFSAPNSKGRVLKFRPRGSIFARPAQHPSPVEGLGKYERDDAPDNYRHRMLMNAAGLAVTIVLVIAGIWIASTMAQLRKDQDCVLSGRRGCTPVEAPIQPRW